MLGLTLKCPLCQPNGGFIVWLHVPNAYFDGDGLVIDYESSVCQSHADAVKAACTDVFCGLITMGPTMARYHISQW